MISTIYIIIFLIIELLYTIFKKILQGKLYTLYVPLSQHFWGYFQCLGLSFGLAFGVF